ncbi:MAG TPA: ABC transporter ATP-binding protein [Candidatus Saccharimonadales bacterium]|nr:ABC transporter ATP-binding protein [Candidatus Saccharimonadales bacterium]
MKNAQTTDGEIVAASNVVKKFGKFRALDGLDLNISRGEVHGFLGPNGAGKSTTIRILLGILRKTSGSVSVLGGDPWKDAVELHRRLAYVPGETNLWPNLSGGEVIDLFGTLRGGLDKKRRDELLDRFQLDPRKKCRTYSKGNRQKVALIAALASDVEFYVMDEPTSGLDPLMGAIFQEYVRDLKKQGKTVLLSSHILAEAEALCDRVTIIREGKTVESGTLDELRHIRRTSVTVETAKPITGLLNISGLYNLEVKGKRAKFQVETSQIDTALQHILKFDILSLVSTPPSLEELFLQHYDDNPSIAEAEASEKQAL